MISRTSATALVCLGMAFTATNAPAQQKPLKDQLVGTWNVTSWEQVMPNGEKLHRFGTDPKGVNVFTPEGRFFVMFARPDLPRVSSNNPMKPTPEEAVAIQTGSIAYFGTYTVDEPNKVIEMRIETSTLPNQLGVPQRRTISSLTADQLSYQNPTPAAGGRIEVAFRRAPTAMTTGAAPMAR